MKGNNTLSIRRTISIIGLCWGTASLVSASQAKTTQPPLTIARQGAFTAGGTTVGTPSSSAVCDHGQVEYQIPAKARSVGLFLWHSSSVNVWKNRWDGGEGFESIFLRRGFPIFLWDGPRVGRANLPCAPMESAPELGSDQQSFTAWRFGPSYMNWYPDVQFPRDDKQAWDQAIRARYTEYDNMDNAKLQAHAAAAALERTGPVVLVTNSAGGLRALLTAIESDKVKAIVAYENVGFVLPESENDGVPPGKYGPVYVPLETFKKLAKIPMQFVWGDHLSQPRGPQMALPANRKFVELINSYGGKAEILELAEQGLKGNTHLPFADMNNVAVADQLQIFLARHNLSEAPTQKPGTAKSKPIN